MYLPGFDRNAILQRGPDLSLLVLPLRCCSVCVCTQTFCWSNGKPESDKETRAVGLRSLCKTLSCVQNFCTRAQSIGRRPRLRSAMMTAAKVGREEWEVTNVEKFYSDHRCLSLLETFGHGHPRSLLINVLVVVTSDFC